jgi:hypothetical protein
VSVLLLFDTYHHLIMDLDHHPSSLHTVFTFEVLHNLDILVLSLDFMIDDTKQTTIDKGKIKLRSPHTNAAAVSILMKPIVLLSIGLAAHATSWQASRRAAFTSHHGSSRKIFLHPKNSHVGTTKSSHNPSAEWDEEPGGAYLSKACELEGRKNGDSSVKSKVEEKHGSESRRSFMKSASLSIAGAMSASPLAFRPKENFASSNNVANAMGLVTFPCPEGSLMNEYHIMRAGQSLLEEQGIISTNQLFL